MFIQAHTASWSLSSGHGKASVKVIRSGELKIIRGIPGCSCRLCYVLVKVKRREYIKVLAGKRNILMSRHVMSPVTTRRLFHNAVK